MTLLGWIVGCAATWGNLPPRLIAVNGVRVDAEGELPAHHPALRVQPGGELVLELEVSDPEGDPVWIWTPRAPAGLHLPRRATRGTYRPPEGARIEPIELVLEDRRRAPRRRSGWTVPVHGAPP